MKKRAFLYVISFTLVLLLLCSCGQTPPVSSSGDTATAHETVPATQARPDTEGAPISELSSAPDAAPDAETEDISANPVTEDSTPAPDTQTEPETDKPSVKPAPKPKPTQSPDPKPSTQPPPTVVASKPYYLKVNNSANTITVYTADEAGTYSIPYKAMICSTGKSTPKNKKYKLTGSRWVWKGLYGNVYGQYTTQITGDILFHSVPYTTKKDKGSLEYWEYDKLGTACSMGCVRLKVIDALWIYNNMTNIAAVEFYSSADPGPLGKPGARKISDNTLCRGWDPTDPDPENPWNKTSPEITTEPDTEPVTEPDTEPVTEPDTEPVTEPDTEPVTEPDTEPVTEPITEPITEPAGKRKRVRLKA